MFLNSDMKMNLTDAQLLSLSTVTGSSINNYNLSHPCNLRLIFPSRGKIFLFSTVSTDSGAHHLMKWVLVTFQGDKPAGA